MLSKQRIKYLQSLHRSKFRKQNQQFVIEGEKIVSEALSNDWEVECVYASADWLEKNASDFSVPFMEVGEKEMAKISQLKSASNVAALVNIWEDKNEIEIEEGKWYVGLESVRDPGNLGTIIRTADWFGIDGVFLSSDCVEIFNPKVLQSTMGSFFRVKNQTVELEKIVESFMVKGIPVYATSLDGEDITKLDSFDPGLILFGNESKGLSSQLQNSATRKLLIPGRGGAESLNIGVAVGIVLSTTA